MLPTTDGLDRQKADAAAVVVLGLALAVFLGLAAYWVFDELKHSRELREDLLETFETRTEVNRLILDLEDAETGQRGYVITGDPSYLKPYEAARQDLPRRFENLARKFADAPNQGARLGKVKGLADEKFREMDATIADRRDRGQAAAAARVSEGRGRALMDDIRGVVDQMRWREAHAIDATIEQDRRRSEQTEQIILLMFFGLIIGAVVSVFLVRRYAEARHTLLVASQAEAARERAVFEAAMDGILILGRDGIIERANPAAERMFGREHNQLLGQPAASLFDAATAGMLAPILDGTAAPNEGGLRREAVGVRKDGPSFPIELSLAEMKVDSGGVLLFTRDISERRQVERMKDEFVSTVSHELRTPLTSIAGSLGLIAGGAAGALPDKAARLIGIAQSNSQRLVRLINDVLDLEKIESGKLPFNFTPLDLRDVAQRAIDGVRGYADQLGVEITLNDGPPEPVRADSDRLLQVITNLLSNACKYSPKGETVRVVVDRDGASARLSVADSGPGVPEAFRDRIFSRFAQADSSDARGKGGTGLGLYIAKEIAERHGGRLWFESSEGGGATFHLELPLLEGAAGGAKFGTRDRVLLVEDEPAAAAMLTAILADEGLKTEHAGTLAAAREYLKEPERFGAIVLDLRLPDGDGMDLVKELRRRSDTRGVPVVVVSADAARGHDPEVRTLEVIDWMEKPVDPDRLAELVRSAVVASEPGGKVILHVDDDRDIREVVATALADAGEVVSVDGVTQARGFIAERRPDLVILDLELRDGSGVELLAELERDGVPVVVFSAQDATDGIGASATAVLVKSRTSLAGLVGAVRELVEHPRSEAAEEKAS